MSYRGKRAMDLVLTAPVFLLSLPVQAATATAIWFKMGRPVVFRQQRPGLGGQPFEMLKFRTMRLANPEQGRVSDSERITQLGAFLRSTSLDELPALWNVIKGDMSLVGPRPLLMQYVDRYNPEQTRRHEVRPGLTGLAQVAGRNSISWDEKFKYDVQYVESHSFGLDTRIILRTVIQVLRREGINAEGEATMPEFLGSGLPQ